MSLLSSLVLVLALAVPIARAIECVQCLEYDDAGITGDQATKVGMIQFATGLKKCKTGTDRTACTDTVQNVCLNVKLSSKLGGNETHSMVAMDCGISSADNTNTATCTGFQQGAAGINITLESCAATNCNSDGCNSGYAVRLSSLVLISVITAWLL